MTMKDFYRHLLRFTIIVMAMVCFACDEETEIESVDYEILVYGRETCGLTQGFINQANDKSLSYSFYDVDSDKSYYEYTSKYNIGNYLPFVILLVEGEDVAVWSNPSIFAVMSTITDNGGIVEDFVIPENISLNVNELSNSDKEKMLELVNKARTTGCMCGNDVMPPVSAIRWNTALEQSALNHSNDMYTNNYYSHVGLNGSSFTDRISFVGYNWATAAENIANGYESVDDVMQGWIESEGHCKNIMNSNLEEMGAAKAGSFWTQNFGKAQ